jgi:cytidine deaminase
MEIKKINISYEEYDENDTISSSDEKLIHEAVCALDGSYAPYSEFHVGAAVLLGNGVVIKGSNQENAAYPSGLCAERVALFYASSKYPNESVASLAITGKSNHFVSTEPITPCGSCRQVIAEIEKKQGSKIRVIMKGEKGVTRVVEGIDSLLPMVFHEDKLKKSKK